MPELSEIAKKRRLLGLGQVELARRAGVSQSLIAKLERGLAVPSYGNAKKIFDALSEAEEKNALSARDVMNTKIVGVKKSDSLLKVVEVLRRLGISQVPVFDGERVVGSVSEQTVVERVAKGEGARMAQLTVEDVMDDSFSIVDESTPLSIVSSLLKYNSAVLVSKKGKTAGIVTKADLLKVVHR
ncbi:MAG: CBS domain-containing protein [Candidatus Micrarchaeia archaeon]